MTLVERKEGGEINPLSANIFTVLGIFCLSLAKIRMAYPLLGEHVLFKHTDMPSSFLVAFFGSLIQIVLYAIDLSPQPISAFAVLYCIDESVPSFDLSAYTFFGVWAHTSSLLKMKLHTLEMNLRVSSGVGSIFLSNPSSSDIRIASWVTISPSFSAVIFS
jgi:hypothetical protein